MGTGYVSTVGGLLSDCSHSDGSPVVSRFDRPRGVVYSPDSSFLLVVDQDGKAIRRYTHSDNTWDTVVSESAGVLNSANDITVDRYGSFVLVTDLDDAVIMKFSLEDWDVFSIVCGVSGVSGHVDGAKGVSLISKPHSVVLSRDGSYAVFSDMHAVRRVEVATGEVRTLAGGDIGGYRDGNSSASVGARFNTTGGLRFMADRSEAFVMVSCTTGVFLSDSLHAWL